MQNSGVRFAPSPTGLFHLGNLRTAWISYTIAKTLKQDWIVRHEEIDGKRIFKEALESQRSDFKELGMTPDQEFFQSQNKKRHFEIFLWALQNKKIYPCFCSRNALKRFINIQSAPHPTEEDLRKNETWAEAKIPLQYSGHCREHLLERIQKDKTGISWRYKNTDPSGALDFVFARTKDLNPDFESFSPSYHLACGADDFDGGYALLVRAYDLAHAYTIQREIYKLCSLMMGVEKEIPNIFHTSLVLNTKGARLEKRTENRKDSIVNGVDLSIETRFLMTPKMLLDGFERSFDPSTLSKAGELRKSLLLTDLWP